MFTTFIIPWDLVFRLVAAAILGGAVGIERVWHGRPAGLRTNMLISMSSCLFTILSVQGFGHGPDQDITRIASQIVVGVGFLGAGTMMHSQKHVLGLTTASTIWLVAAIGMTVGVGLVGLGAVVAFIAIVCLTCLAPVSAWLEKHATRQARLRGIRVLHDDQDAPLVILPAKKKRKKKNILSEEVGKD